MKKKYQSVVFMLAVCLALSGCDSRRESSLLHKEAVEQEVSEEGTEGKQQSTVEESAAVPQEDKEGEKETGIMDYSAYGEEFHISPEVLFAYQGARRVTDKASPDMLPGSLVALLKEALVHGMKSCHEEEDILKGHEAEEHRMTYTELLQYFGRSPEQLEEETFYWNGVELLTIYLADVNGDGKEEIITYEYGGGTLRRCDVRVYQKEEEGPVLDDSFWNYMDYGELFFVEGEYYFVTTNKDFSTGERIGYYVLSFQEDATFICHEVSLSSTRKEREWFTLYSNETIEADVMQEIVAYIEYRKKELEEMTIPEESGEYQLIYGQAERTFIEAGEAFAGADFGEAWKEHKEEARIVDMDNDGVDECIGKRIWYPTSLHQSLQLEYLLLLKQEESGIRQMDLILPGYIETEEYAVMNEYGTWPGNSWVQLWFEEFGGKNYTFEIDRLGTEGDYVLTVSLLEKDRLIPILQYLLIDSKEFTITIGETEQGN